MNERKALAISAIFLVVFLLISGAIFKPEKTKEIFEKAEDYVAGTFFRESVDDKELLERYEKVRNRNGHFRRDEIRVLIVPGHDDESFGAQFRGIREVDLNRELSKHLYNFLKKEKGFDVMLASDSSGYNKDLQKYFDKEEEDIKEFRSQYREIMNRLINDGRIDPVSGIFHNSASEEVSLKLYGINKWVNDEDFDIVIHVHFNDHPGRRYDTVGKYNGFSIYIPESQFSNARASKIFAEYLFEHFGNFLPQSNNPVEKDGIIEDQELIAIGAYNTVDAISVLVEYGYIYENQFSTPELRELIMRELAFQTFKGVKNFFNDEEGIEETTLLSEYMINSNLFEGQRDSSGVLALQALLRLEGFYPPEGKDLNECPLTGNFGPCTKEALIEFQKENDLKGTGNFGNQTRELVKSKI